MTIDFFYSDPHFGHKNIIDLCGRPFQSVKHMHDTLVGRYNADVDDGKVVLWVGDCFFMSLAESKAMLEKLNGTKVLVRGNHDRSAARMAEIGFAMVAEHVFVRVGDHRVKVSHYPYASRDPDERYRERRPKRAPGEWLIQGHTHSRKRSIGREIHVGVDAWDYRPVPFADVEALILGGA